MPAVRAADYAELGVNEAHPEYRVKPVVRSGAVVKYAIIDSAGRDVPTFFRQEAVGARVVCWQCYRGKDGKVHCFQVRCPKLIGGLPKSITR